MANQDSVTGDNNLLSSWKEISAYLGRDIRTCLRWEKSFGLPIHRLDPHSEKSRVFAYKDELSGWLHQSKTGGPHAHGNRRRSSRRVLLWAVLFPLLGAAAIVLFLLVRSASTPGEPANFAIKGPVLVVLDDAGKVLWRYDTGFENLSDERLYRNHFQFRRVQHPVDMPYLLIKDIDQDGGRETLFSLQTVDERGEGELLCFDRKGGVRWSFKTGREMRYGSKTYSGDFRINGLSTDDLDGDGRLEIMVIADHRPDWPCQLTVLDSGGRERGEFWNSGYFNDLTAADLNGDGFKEILAAGMNNEYGVGCLAVFDAASIRGGSPQENPDFRCPELEPGSELYYLLFPRTDVDLAGGYPVDGLISVEMLSNKRIQVKTNLSRVYFDLSLNLDSPELIFDHGFIIAHDNARREGKVTSTLNGEYKRDLLQGIRYWNGNRWSSLPAMNRSWEEVRLPNPDLAGRTHPNKRKTQG
jgi:hypothetical protein